MVHSLAPGCHLPPWCRLALAALFLFKCVGLLSQSRAFALPVETLLKASSLAPVALQNARHWEMGEREKPQGLKRAPHRNRYASLEGAQFVSPNEQQPIFAQSHWDLMPQGSSYFAVGTERGFLGAAVTKAAGLILVDVSPAVFVFNTINALLLKVATDMSSYVWLRLKAPLSEWLSELTPVLPSGVEATEFFEFWHFFVRDNNPWKFYTPNGFLFFHSLPGHMQHPAFEGVNYLFNESLFSHLSQLAKEERIVPVLANLTLAPEVAHRVAPVGKDLAKVGLFDLSNLIPDIHRFGTAEGLMQGLLQLTPLAHPLGHVMATQFFGYWGPVQRQWPRQEATRWSYGSVTFQEMLALIKRGTPPQEWFTF